MRSVCPKAKAKAKAAAKVRNTVARTVKVGSMRSDRTRNTNLASLWNLGRGSKFPLHPDDMRNIQKTTGTIRDLAKKWADDAAKTPPCSASFPKVISHRRIVPVSLIGLNELQQQGVNVIMEGLKVLFGKRGVYLNPDACKFEMDAVLVKHSCGQGMIVQPCTVCKAPMFELKVIVYKGQACGNICTMWTLGEGGAMVLEPASKKLWAGVDFAAHLTEHVKDHLPGVFSFRRVILHEDPVASPPGALAVIGSEEIDLEQIREATKNQAELCQSMRLLRKSMQPWQHQKVHEKVRKFRLVEKKAKAAKGGAPAADGAGAPAGHGAAAPAADGAGAPAEDGDGAAAEDGDAESSSQECIQIIN